MQSRFPNCIITGAGLGGSRRLKGNLCVKNIAMGLLLAVQFLYELQDIPLFTKL